MLGQNFHDIHKIGIFHRNVWNVFISRHTKMHAHTESNKLQAMRKISPVNLLTFYELKFQTTGLFFCDKNMFRPRLIAPAFMRFCFVSHSHPLQTLLAEKFFHFCLQATK
jgi:hypothetical protein